MAGNDIILSWISAEAGYGMIRVDAEGKKKWGTLRSGISQMVSDGERLFLSTGFDDEDVPPSLLECNGIEMLGAKDFRPMLFGNGSKSIPPPEGASKEDNVVSGLALCKGTLFASYRKRNIVAAYDALKGDLKETWNVPSPGFMASRPDGSIVLISDNKLSVLKDGKLSTLASDHLEEPKGVAADAAGNIYVSNYGKLQNVSVFSPDGKYLKSIGKVGGRPRVGAFDPEGMLCPKAIAIGPKGKLWVTEAIEAPKRISVWNCQTGKLEKEFFGAAHYSAFIWMDPEHPDEIYCDNVIWKVDLKNKTWYPKSTIWRSKDPNSPGLFGTHGNGFRMFTAKNGHQYGWGGDEHLGTVLSIREGDIMKPIMMFFWTYEKKKNIGFPITSDTKKYPDLGTYIWVDRNNDQIIQEEEITSVAKLSPECASKYFRGFSCVDKDLNIWHAKGAVNRPLKVLEDGRPEYDFTKPEPTPVGPQFVDDSGSLYALSDDDNKPEKVGYGKWSPDGKLQWGLMGYSNWPKALSYPSQKPGKLWGPTMILGMAGEFTGFNTYFGVGHIYTADGLFVSRIFKDVRAVSDKLDSNIISCENYNGCLVKPKGMEQYFFLGGDQDGRVTEVLGLDTVRRLKGGEYVISEEDTKKAASEFADYHAKLSQMQKLIIGRGIKSLDTVKPVVKTLDSKRIFEAKAAYDDKNLYVRYKVISPAKLVNGVPDSSIIFKGGNLIDIQMATNPQADPKRKTPVPGDIRILATRQNGTPVVVIFRPKITGFAGSPITLTSPVGKEPFDAIEVCDKIAVDYQEDKNLQSFTATLTIPLELIGWKPVKGAKVKMDLGYIYGNNEGNKAMARSYWKNNGFSANVLNDVPSESKLEPAEWGEGEVE